MHGSFFASPVPMNESSRRFLSSDGGPQSSMAVCSGYPPSMNRSRSVSPVEILSEKIPPAKRSSNPVWMKSSEYSSRTSLTRLLRKTANSF